MASKVPKKKTASTPMIAAIASGPAESFLNAINKNVITAQ